MTEPVKARLRDKFWGAVAGVSTAVGVPVALVAASFHTPHVIIGGFNGLDLVAPFAAAAIGVVAGIGLGIKTYLSASDGSAYRHSLKN